MNIFERLKNERDRLGLTQPRLGELLGVGKTTVIRWEKGESAPDAVQLATLANAGADALYILTGQRSQGLPPVATLPPDQQVLVTAYERCTSEGKQHLIQTAALLSAGLPIDPVKASSKRAMPKDGISIGNMTNSAPGSVQVGYARGRVKTKVVKE